MRKPWDKNEKLNKNTENIKKNQRWLFLESESTTKLKNSIEIFNRRFVQTEENLEILEKKLAGLDQTENKMGQLSAQDRAGTPNFIKVELSVPYYVQANNYYCGPATVKEIVQYFFNFF